MIRKTNGFHLGPWTIYQVMLTTFILLRLVDARPRAINRRRIDFEWNIHYKNSRLNPVLKDTLMTRRVKIYSKASGSHIRIIGRKVDSLGSEVDQDAILVLERVAFSVIRIRSQGSNHFLCMNRKGHLVGKPGPVTSPRCMFVVEDDHPSAYLKYISLANSKHLVAFNKNGKPRSQGKIPSPHHRSVLFLERPVAYPFEQTTNKRKVLRPRRRDFCLRTGKKEKRKLKKSILRLWNAYCVNRGDSLKEDTTKEKSIRGPRARESPG